jgi:phosphoribosylformimino-5-aminoimidazole carboxamide ribotide isomerase
MREATSLQMEVGGGIRSLASIEQVIGLGIERVILGTIALTDRGLLEEALRRWGERIAVGLDARDGRVSTSGWRDTSQTRATVLAAELCAIGVRRFIYTDISRDGALGGPNLEAIMEMQRAISRGGGMAHENQMPMESASQCSLIASGGVSSLEDLRSLAALGVEGAIVGKAIYTGSVDLAAAIQELEG